MAIFYAGDAFADGRWAGELTKRLAPYQLVPKWRPRGRMRRGTYRQWIQFEPDGWKGAFFWSGKPALISSDTDLFVGYLVERGLPLSHPVEAEQMTKNWHWHGFDRCLTDSSLRTQLSEMMLDRPDARRTIWLSNSDGLDRQIPYQSPIDLRDCKAIVDKVPPDQWVDVVVGTRFPIADCLADQDAILPNLRHPIIRAADVRALVESARSVTP